MKRFKKPGKNTQEVEFEGLLTDKFKNEEMDKIKKNHPDMCPVTIKKCEKAKTTKNVEHDR